MSNQFNLRRLDHLSPTCDTSRIIQANRINMPPAAKQDLRTFYNYSFSEFISLLILKIKKAHEL